MTLTWNRRGALLLLGVVVLASGGVALHSRYKKDSVTPVSPVTTSSPAEIRSGWRTSVQTIFAEYDRTQDAEAAKNGLLALRVVAPDQEVHLALVLALQGMTESRVGAKQALEAARQRFDGS
ncbi:hypothetical protein KBA73_03145 [Patescibacteria group bacterium]|nr:hypothetical protein [Patescibacteria group bacterium]